MPTTFDVQPYGFSWRFDGESQQRVAHALDTGDGVWLVDPIADEEALERAAALGPAKGVLQLLDRHNRDCGALARRLGVPRLRLPADVPGSPFEVVSVLSMPGWHEIALWWPEPRALVVADALGTSPYYALGRAAGMHPALRPFPPRALRDYAPEHLLVGHGQGVHDGCGGRPAGGLRARPVRPAAARGEAARPRPRGRAGRARQAYRVTARSRRPTAQAPLRRPT